RARHNRNTAQINGSIWAPREPPGFAVFPTTGGCVGGRDGCVERTAAYAGAGVSRVDRRKSKPLYSALSDLYLQRTLRSCPENSLQGLVPCYPKRSSAGPSVTYA